jgi:hypothetical protein
MKKPLMYFKCPFCAARDQPGEVGFIWSARPGEGIVGPVEVTMKISTNASGLTGVQFQISRPKNRDPDWPGMTPGVILVDLFHVCPELQEEESPVEPPEGFAADNP